MSFSSVHSDNSNQDLYRMRSVSSEESPLADSSALFNSKKIEIDASKSSEEIFLSTKGQEMKKGIQEEALQNHQVELLEKSEDSFSERKVISDDFPPFTSLGRYLGNMYKQAHDRWASYWLPTLKLPLSVPHTRPLPQQEGLTGLSNHHGTCYLNTALQTLKVALTIVLEQGTPQEQKRVNEALMSRMPSMLNLMNKELRTEGELQQLYREVAHELASDLWYSWNYNKGVGAGQLKTGYKRSGDTINYLTVLLHQLGVEPLYLEYTRHQQSEYHSWQHLPSSCFLLSKPSLPSPSPYISPLLEASLQQTQSPILAETYSLQELIKKAFVKDHCRLVEPFPAVLGVEVRECNLKIEKTLSFSQKEESSICYEVAVVTISTNRHAFTFIRKNNNWYEVNDEMIFEVPKEWEKELEDYIQAHGSFVLFGKKETLPTRLETTSQESKDLRLEFEERKLLGHVKQTFPYWPKGPTPFKDLCQLIESLGAHSFFFKQFSRCLGTQEISLSTDPFLKATQEFSQAHEKALQTHGSEEEVGACWEEVLEKTKEIIRALDHDADFDPAIITELKLAWEESLVLFTKQKEEAMSVAATIRLKAR